MKIFRIVYKIMLAHHILFFCLTYSFSFIIEKDLAFLLSYYFSTVIEKHTSSTVRQQVAKAVLAAVIDPFLYPH
jgi:hypothetical protein